MKDELMDSQDAADYLGISLSTFKRYVKQGRIKGEVQLIENERPPRPGARTKPAFVEAYSKTQLDEFYASRRKRSSKPVDEEWPDIIGE